MQFEFKSIIFPAPKPQYSKKEFDTMQYVAVANNNTISRNHKYKHTTRHVPYLFIQNMLPTNMYLIYFHGNAEDISYASKFIMDLMDYIQFNAIVVEYPGYGIYNDYECSHEQMEEDARHVYDSIKMKYQILDKQIILFGRSIGSGVAISLAVEKSPRCVITMSAYSSIKAAAKEHVSILSYFVKERFNNAERASKMQVPALIIHGEDDTLIPYQHSLAIFNNLPKQIQDISKIQIHPLMTHNQYLLDTHLVIPITQFLNQLL